MTYDPSHRSQPLRQERWPAATPAEPWRAYREDDSYPYGIPAVADHQGSHRTTAGVGSRSQPGYADAARGAAAPRYTGYQSNWETSGPSQWSRNSWETSDRSRPDWDGNSYRDAGTSDYDTQAGYASQTGHGTQAGHPTQANYAARTGYGDGFDGARMDQDHSGTQNGYADTAQGYSGAPVGRGEADGYGVQYEFSDASGYAGTQANPGGAQDLAEASYGYRRDPEDFTGPERAAAWTVLTAPDADLYPEGWRSDQEHRRELRRRGLVVGAITGVLATATASAVSILAAAFVRPQASPLLAAYDAFIDRMPAALRNFTAVHFGTHGRDVLLLGLYVSVALLGLGIGMLARRAAALGVAGLATLSVLGAFVTITRPQGQVIDVLPAVAGGLAGVMALLWLLRASAPPVAQQHARTREPRRAR
jgi:hypothetical protein